MLRRRQVHVDVYLAEGPAHPAVIGAFDQSEVGQHLHVFVHSLHVELDATGFEHLCEAMRLHNDGHTTGDPAVLACWDADRLDLGRVGTTPHASRLCTAPARNPHAIMQAMRMSSGIGRRR
jgi:hypothetical protein